MSGRSSPKRASSGRPGTNSGSGALGRPGWVEVSRAVPSIAFSTMGLTPDGLSRVALVSSFGSSRAVPGSKRPGRTGSYQARNVPGRAGLVYRFGFWYLKSINL